MPDRAQRGFAGMDEQKQREIASQGGRAAHRKGTAHEFTTEEARIAGRKGGESVSKNRDHMSEIGRKGGKTSRANRAANRAIGHPGAVPRVQQNEGNTPGEADAA